MRILHVTDAYLPRLGGIEMHVHDLAQAQAAAGDDVDIITMTRWVFDAVVKRQPVGGFM